MEDGAVGSPRASASGPTGSPVTVELVVGGMHCPSCAALVEETLTGDPAVHYVRVDLDAARASVTFDPTTLTVDDVCAAVAGVGYTATIATSGAPGS
jgi:copper chaperone CopZ